MVPSLLTENSIGALIIIYDLDLFDGGMARWSGEPHIL
jgi:hypothetical protein